MPRSANVCPRNRVRYTATCNGEDFTGAPTASECSFDVAVKKGAESITAARLNSTGMPLQFSATPDMADDDSKVVKTIELYISDDEDDGDWDKETIVLTLELQDKSVTVVTVVTKRDDSDDDGDVDTDDEVDARQTRKLTATPRKLTLTINDDERKPTFKFDPPNIQLAKGNIQDVTALVGLDTGGRVALGPDDADIRTKLTGLIEAGDDVLLSVSPPGAVGTLIEFVDSNDMKMDLPSCYRRQVQHRQDRECKW